VDLPLSVASKDIGSVLAQRFFAEGGKYYLCRSQSCDDVGHDVYLEWPGVHIEGARIALTAHLSGNLTVQVGRFVTAHPGVTASVLVSAVPQLVGDDLRFIYPHVAISSQNGVVNVAKDQLTARLAAAIAAASVNMRSIVANAIGPYLPAAPVLIGDRCLALGADDVRVRSVIVQSTDDSLEFLLTLKPHPAEAGQCPTTPP
jgi:hypothetical protein